MKWATTNYLPNRLLLGDEWISYTWRLGGKCWGIGELQLFDCSGSAIQWIHCAAETLSHRSAYPITNDWDQSLALFERALFIWFREDENTDRDTETSWGGTVSNHVGCWGVSPPPFFFLSKTITHWDNFRANEGCLVSSLNPPSDALALLLFQVEAKPNKYNQ